MLLSFHYPTADLRSFFLASVGRVDQFDRFLNPGRNSSGHLPFIRSAGSAKMRFLGGGGALLKENHFFDFSRTMSLVLRGNILSTFRFDLENSKTRYYQFDQVCGRFDLCLISKARGTRAGFRPTIERIVESAIAQTQLSFHPTYFQKKTGLLGAAKLISEFIQSRTTKEAVLKQGKVVPATFASPPITFVEAIESEVQITANLQPIPVELSGIRLYHSYPANGLRCWTIVREVDDLNHFRKGRLLRMHLSRLYCQQEAFRLSVRNLPSVVQREHEAGTDSFIPDEYSAFFTTSRRFISKIVSGDENSIGADFGTAARFAFEMIDDAEVETILEHHRLLISRRNIWRNFEADLKREAMEKKLFESDRPIVVTNKMFNFLGIQKAKQNIENIGNWVQLARPSVEKEAITEILIKLARGSQAFGSGISISKQDAIFNSITDLSNSLKYRGANGPAVLNKILEIRPMLQEFEFGVEKLEAILTELQEAVLASYRLAPPAIDVVRLLPERGEIGASRPGQSKARKSAMLKILFLAANPSNTERLDLEEELRAIERELRAVKFRDNISFVAKHAVRADDLLFYLREEKPDVVHFSGHGSPDGIIVREDGNGERPVANKALARLLKDRGVKLVVLNSCYSEAQAEEIDRSVPAVVGTTDALDDEAGRKFSAAFYRTLGNGHSLADAFRDGGDAVQLHDLSDVFQIRGDGSTIYLS